MDDDLDLFGWVGGTVDGKYRVDRVVGRGGFGVVYRAHHLGFDQTVAIKCLLLPKTLSGPERDRFQETFLSEGRLLHQLSRATAGIVQALDLGAAVSPTKQWTPYLVLEWLDGKPLDRDFAERRAGNLGGRSIAAALELLAPAAKALEIAHNQGVAHRDIKPANLFIATIAGKSVVKVLDFGIAKVMAETESVTRAFEETGASVNAFTARYGAPEQFSRRYGATGPWTDVFSFALVFVEAVTGRYALEGTDAAQLFVSAADPERRPTLRGLGYSTPDAIEEVMKRALAVDPRERYGTAGEFWTALEEAALVTGAVVLEPDSKKRMRSAPEPGLVPIGPEAQTTPEPIAHLSTELSSSTHVGNAVGTGPPPSRRGSSLGLMLVLGAAALVTGAVGTFAVRSAIRDHLPVRPRAPVSASLSAPPSARAEETEAPNAPAAGTTLPPPITDVTPKSAPSNESAPTSPRARNAAEAPLLGGVPERNVPGGITGDAFVRGFRILARENAYGLDFTSASKQCADVGMALCTETQWAHACESVPEVGKVASWTASVGEDDGIVVRGGDLCESKTLARPETPARARFALCCERAIAMTTNNLQKQYLSTTGDRVLMVERAMNQRNIPALLELSEPIVHIDDEPKTQTELGTLLERDFAAAPDLVVTNDVCEIQVQAKKVVKRARKRRKPVTTYETQGWTAECRQTAVLAGQVTSRVITYSFTAKSKLREIRTKPSE